MNRNEERNILIVDDEGEIRDLIGAILRPHRYGIFFAENGREALELVENGWPFSLILTDIHMPAMDGLKLFEETRSRGIGAPFVFLTADGDKETLGHALRLGAFDFIEKPFVTEYLEATVQAAVEAGMAILRNVRLLDMLAIEGGPLEAIARRLSGNDQARRLMRLKNKRRTGYLGE